MIDFPSGALADDTIRRTVSALVKGKGLSPDDVARAAGLSRSAYFSKMKAHGREKAFKAGEVAGMAEFLGVKVQDLYDGLGGTFVPDVRARGDSNSQPSDLESANLIDFDAYRLVAA